MGRAICFRLLVALVRKLLNTDKKKAFLNVYPFCRLELVTSVFPWIILFLVQPY